VRSNSSRPALAAELALRLHGRTPAWWLLCSNFFFPKERPHHVSRGLLLTRRGFKHNHSLDAAVAPAEQPRPPGMVGPPKCPRGPCAFCIFHGAAGTYATPGRGFRKNGGGRRQPLMEDAGQVTVRDCRKRSDVQSGWPNGRHTAEGLIRGLFSGSPSVSQVRGWSRGRLGVG